MRMKLILRSRSLALLLFATMAYGKDFSQTLTPEEFAAAGLNALTAEQLARLDALIARKEAAVVTRVTKDVTAKQKEVAASAPHQSFLNRMKVVLTPGTEINYESVETSLVGSFRGYQAGTVLTLANDQQWRVVDGTYWAPAKNADRPRKVVIQPGALGSFFLEIEDGGRPKVKFVRNLK
jgi:hypothetical protein